LKGQWGTLYIFEMDEWKYVLIMHTKKIGRSFGNRDPVILWLTAAPGSQ